MPEHQCASSVLVIPIFVVMDVYVRSDRWWFVNIGSGLCGHPALFGDFCFERESRRLFDGSLRFQSVLLTGLDLSRERRSFFTDE